MVDLGDVASLVSAVLGVVGTVTGVIALRRTSSIKVLDLRIEYRRTRGEQKLRAVLLMSRVIEVVQSRDRALRAVGIGRESRMEEFKRLIEEDTERIESVIQTLDGLPETGAELSDRELEDLLIKVHATKLLLDAQDHKLQGYLDEDAEFMKRAHFLTAR